MVSFTSGGVVVDNQTITTNDNGQITTKKFVHFDNTEVTSSSSSLEKKKTYTFAQAVSNLRVSGAFNNTTSAYNYVKFYKNDVAIALTDIYLISSGNDNGAMNQSNSEVEVYVGSSIKRNPFCVLLNVDFVEGDTLDIYIRRNTGTAKLKCVVVEGGLFEDASGDYVS